MDFGRHSSQIQSKFEGTYRKLFQGFTPQQIAPNDTQEQFFSGLFDLDVKPEYLRGELDRATKDRYLGSLKPLLNMLFRECVAHGHSAKMGDVRKSHSLETLSILIRSVLAKNLTGWEVMEILAGGVSLSDTVFMDFTAMINDILADEEAPAVVRHQALQTALIYMCGIGQLSPGAYFLRRDLFPSIAIFIKSRATEQFAFEAILLQAILANFHKSDAARLNPYLKRIKDTRDEGLLRKVCWASSFALETSIKAYHEIFDDHVKPVFPFSFGSMLAMLRPDRALTLTSHDPPRELFKKQPIEAAVVLLPIFEFLHNNAIFPKILVESISESTVSGRLQPPLFTLLTLSSYLLTHASSTFTPRSMAYANISLNNLLCIVENDQMMKALCRPSDVTIRLCRQRSPALPLLPVQSPPICALLDCCVLWLRHNLHKQLDVYSYLNCIWICYRVLWYFQENRIRLNYHWKELWNAIISLLGFLSTKLDALATTGGVEQVVREALNLLNLALCKAEVFLPSPGTLHEFIYELVRSASVLKNQAPLLASLAMPHKGQTADIQTNLLVSVLDVIDFYEDKVRGAKSQTAKDAMGTIVKEIEANGLHGVTNSREMEAPARSKEVLAFSRVACGDGLALMP
ncbi:hypothetical protein BDZ94DRAFT_989519 [Collybia nuda]|uniref:Armadillo-like helical domain-containing protein n=1 Tax=Collybia nuda TaxID=64659 RepID=A0A9P5XZX0_9AGAR|nr:hypothetical protein BDZ94DRAFT_989519 [Collybia nuda]